MNLCYRPANSPMETSLLLIEHTLTIQSLKSRPSMKSYMSQNEENLLYAIEDDTMYMTRGRSQKTDIGKYPNNLSLYSLH